MKKAVGGRSRCPKACVCGNVLKKKSWLARPIYIYRLRSLVNYIVFSLMIWPIILLGDTGNRHMLFKYLWIHGSSLNIVFILCSPYVYVIGIVNTETIPLSYLRMHVPIEGIIAIILLVFTKKNLSRVHPFARCETTYTTVNIAHNFKRQTGRNFSAPNDIV